MSDSKNSRGHRIDAIKKNAEWLQEHDLEDDSVEAAKRVGLILGDARAIKQSLAGEDSDSLDDVPNEMLLALLVAGESAVLQRLKDLHQSKESDRTPK